MEKNKNLTAEKLKQFLVIIATVGVILINYFASVGYINGVTPEVISDKYPTFITPSGYAFSIWSLIYLGLIGFSIYQALPSQTENPRFKTIRTLYIVNCAANCLWIYLWHHDSILAALAVMFVLLGTLVLINVNLRRSESIAETWLARISFSLYFGWVTVATILNFTIALVFLGVNASESNSIILSSILIVGATALGILIRFKLSVFAYPLAIAWALTAIAIKQSGKTAIVMCAAFGVIALLVSALTVFLQLNNPTHE
ncbi:MAG: tryptophan-rich sensory protein [Acidobacteria bacterium]|nr:tryptophan-rich sensory protein [Acidobacteriota bacterium]